MTVIPALPVVVPLCGLSLAGLIWCWHRSGRLDAFRLVSLMLAVGYAGGVLAVTMFPLRLWPGAELGQLNLLPIVGIDRVGFNLNVAMMLPLGVLLPLLVPIRNWIDVLRWGALVSLLIESTQYLLDIALGADRIADINDVIANSIGAVFGYAGYVIAAGTPGLDTLFSRLSLHQPAGVTASETAELVQSRSA